jgi:PKD repeat protein
VNGEAEMNVFQDWNFSDPGATATDLEDGDLTDQVVSDGVVTTNEPGIYTITYTVSDSAGNRTQAQRIVRVVSPPQVDSIGSGGPAGLLTLLLFALLRGRICRADISL